MILLVQTPADSSKYLLYSWIMSFLESLLTCYKKTFNYSDRASKSEFLWFTLYFITISELGASYAVYFIGDPFSERYDALLDTSLGLFQASVALFFFIPLLVITSLSWFAASVRRLHDMNRSGIWANLIILIPSFGILPVITFAHLPFFGFLILIIFSTMDSSKGRNRFGPKPRK